MDVLVTGITGFIGSHLAELLLKEGCTVHGTRFDHRELPNVAHIVEHIHLLDCDVCDAAAVKGVIAETRPDLVFHLAAYTGDRASQGHSNLAFEVNVLGTVYLLEAIRTESCNPIVLIPVSSAVFGLVERPEEPITEDTPYQPVSPYGASKTAQAQLAHQYGLTYRLNIIRVHTFNCIGPRQSDQFACSAFARQIAEIEKGLRAPFIEVGDLDTYRDLTDVRDVAEAYWLATQKGRPGDVYNICSGRAYSIGAALDWLLSLSSRSIPVRQDPRRTDGASIPFQVGDCRKFSELTHWCPTISVPESLADTLDYWRCRVPAPTPL